MSCPTSVMESTFRPRGPGQVRPGKARPPLPCGRQPASQRPALPCLSLQPGHGPALLQSRDPGGPMRAQAGAQHDCPRCPWLSRPTARGLGRACRACCHDSPCGPSAAIGRAMGQAGRGGASLSPAGQMSPENQQRAAAVCVLEFGQESDGAGRGGCNGARVKGGGRGEEGSWPSTAGLDQLD